MSFAEWMILIAALLPYLTIIPARGHDSGYDNNAPRRWTAAQTGWRARAHWAHQNHLEAFAPFAAAVIVAEMRAAAPLWINLLAGLFVLARIAYTFAYMKEKDALRTMLFTIGLVIVVALFLIAA